MPFFLNLGWGMTVLNEIDSFKINYPNVEILQKYRGISFRVYQAKTLILHGELPTGYYAIVNDKNEPITDFKEAAQKLNKIMNFILNSEDYISLTPDQRCHIKEYSTILLALKHKANLDDIIEWVLINKKDTKRARELRAFLKDGTCNN